MAYLVIVVNAPNESINDFNSTAELPTKVAEGIQGCINALLAVEAGTLAASVQVTTRDTDPGVTTHGTNSQQNTYNHL